MKFKKLSRRLGTPLYATIGLLEALWIATQKNAPRGDIGRFDNEAIAIEIGWEEDPDVLIGHLVDCGWLDENDEHRLVVHDWEEHAPSWVKRKLGRSKEVIVSSKSTLDGTPSSVETTCDEKSEPCTGLEATPNLTKPNLTKPSSSSKKKTFGKEEAKELVSNLGVRKLDCVDAAFSSGITESELVDICDFFGGSLLSDSPGTLYFKLTNWIPGQDVDDGWPDCPEVEAAKTPKAKPPESADDWRGRLCFLAKREFGISPTAFSSVFDSMELPEVSGREVFEKELFKKLETHRAEAP